MKTPRSDSLEPGDELPPGANPELEQHDKEFRQHRREHYKKVHEVTMSHLRLFPPCVLYWSSGLPSPLFLKHTLLAAQLPLHYFVLYALLLFCCF